MGLMLDKFKEQTKEEIKTLNYKKYLYQYSKEDRYKLTAELKNIEIFFKEELEIDVFPIYGTLLGMVRERDYIEWDTDIDMAYMSKCKTPKAVLNEFKLICDFLKSKGMLIKVIKTASHIHIYSPNKKIKIDFWIAWIDENNKTFLTWSLDGEFDSDLIYPFKKIQFYNQEFLLINQYIKFLNYYYKDWQTPLAGVAQDWSNVKPVFRLEPWSGQ